MTNVAQVPATEVPAGAYLLDHLQKEFNIPGVPFRVLSRLLGVPASVEVERATRDVVPESMTRARLSA